MTEITFTPIATIRTDLPTPFGIPRQSGVVPELAGLIEFEPEYRDPNALRGLDAFSHIWLIWHFSEARQDGWTATVRPPRLGGDERVGVFASRSPCRPNGIGMSVVSLDRIEIDPMRGPILHVSGVGLMDRTPILDIKPYIPYSDAIPDASGGFTGRISREPLDVAFPDDLLALIPPDKREALVGVLAQDPRPSYHADPGRRYGFPFAGFDVRFRVEKGVLTVCEVMPLG